MKDKKLFPARPPRECCVCHCTASNGSKKRDQGEPIILAITPVMYRRGTGKGQVRNAASVQVCEECLGKAGTAGWLTWVKDFRPLIYSLFSALLSCARQMAQDDAHPEPAPAHSADSQAALL